MPFLSTDRTERCPYNPSHVVLRSKLLQHLTRCARQHPDAGLQVCPFNAAHHVSEVTFRHHKLNCPDRETIEREKYQITVGVFRGILVPLRTAADKEG